MSRRKVISSITSIIIITLFVMSPVVFAETQKSNAVFDFRVSNPEIAALTLKLIHQSYKDVGAQNPDFAVIFMGPSVKLISQNRDSFASEDQKILDEITARISDMAQDEIQLEICLVAADLFGVDPASVLPEITHVNNGWLASMGYQTKGYSLVPAF